VGRAASVRRMAVSVEPCDPLTRLDEIYEVYVTAHDGRLDDPRDQLWRDEHLPRHTPRDDFDFLVAVEQGGVLGFGYGYTGAYGQWWTDRVAAALEPEVRQAWLDQPHFEVVELHVRPTAQRRGIGTRLLAALLARQPHDRALLTTYAEDHPGLPFYTRLGWQRLGDIRFEGSGRLMVIMGRDGLRNAAQRPPS
jgi:ribosomal protein S18 acetylase RimI-like enzyme